MSYVVLVRQERGTGQTLSSLHHPDPLPNMNPWTVNGPFATRGAAEHAAEVAMAARPHRQVVVMPLAHLINHLTSPDPTGDSSLAAAAKWARAVFEGYPVNPPKLEDADADPR